MGNTDHGNADGESETRTSAPPRTSPNDGDETRAGEEASTYEKGRNAVEHKDKPTLECPGACEGLTQENIEEDEERPVTGDTLPNEQPSLSTSENEDKDPSWETTTEVPPMERPEEGDADRAQGAEKYANTDEGDEEETEPIGKMLTYACSEAEGDARGVSHTSSAEDER